MVKGHLQYTGVYKMGIYGDSAIQAVRLIEKDQAMDPRMAWDSAISSLTESEWSIDKPCPKGAFLGLCEEGLIKGIPKGQYTKSLDNKNYALKAVKILQQSSKPRKKIDLWREVTDRKIVQNGQMDVVLSLWNNNLIVRIVADT
jgi:hypothetical protein